jgi:hypothetical protein
MPSPMRVSPTFLDAGIGRYRRWLQMEELLDQIRVCHQPQNRECTRPHRAGTVNLPYFTGSDAARPLASNREITALSRQKETSEGAESRAKISHWLCRASNVLQNQFTGTKPKSRYGRMNRRRHRGGQALYLAGLLRPRCAVTRRVWCVPGLAGAKSRAPGFPEHWSMLLQHLSHLARLLGPPRLHRRRRWPRTLSRHCFCRRT